jgi:hypothetical protein
MIVYKWRFKWRYPNEGCRSIGRLFSFLGSGVKGDPSRICGDSAVARLFFPAVLA